MAPHSLHNHPAPPARLSLDSQGSPVLPGHRNSAYLPFMPLSGQPLSNSAPRSYALKLSGLFDPMLKTSATIKSHPVHLPLLRLPLPPAAAPSLPPLKPHHGFAPSHLCRQSSECMQDSPCNAKFDLEIPLPTCTPVIPIPGSWCASNLLPGACTHSSPLSGARQQAGTKVPPLPGGCLPPGVAGQM